MRPRSVIGLLIARFSTTRYLTFLCVYLGATMLVSLPITIVVWNLLYTNGVPTGGDPADHVYFAMQIIDTKNPLIHYGQFPSLEDNFSQYNSQSVYYPSFLHIVVSIFSIPFLILGIDTFTAILQVMQGFMFIVYLAGIVGYSLLIKYISDSIISKFDNNFVGQNKSTLIYFILLLLAFSIFIYSTSPILKTFRDGGYGEIFAMWAMLPFYLILLMKRHWILSGMLFGIIAFTHNLSFFLTSLVTVSYFIGLLIAKEYKILRGIKLYVAVAFVSCLPAIIFFYYPTLHLALEQRTGISGASSYWSRLDVAEQVHFGLYIYGLCSAIVLLCLNYRSTSWLVGWVILYLVPFHFNLFFLERFARELSIPFGILAGILPLVLFYSIMFRLYKSKNAHGAAYTSLSNFLGRRELAIVLLITIIVIPLYSGYFADRFKLFGDPVALNYYTKTISESHKYFKDTFLFKGFNGSVLLFGVDPWIKPYLFGNASVLESETETGEKSLGAKDRNINQKLRSIIEMPNSAASINSLKEFNVKYILLSDLIDGRWYSDPEIQLTNIFADFEGKYDRNIFHLEKQWRGDDNEIIQIYSINQENLDHDIAKS